MATRLQIARERGEVILASLLVRRDLLAAQLATLDREIADRRHTLSELPLPPPKRGRGRPRGTGKYMQALLRLGGRATEAGICHEIERTGRPLGGRSASRQMLRRMLREGQVTRDDLGFYEVAS